MARFALRLAFAAALISPGSADAADSFDIATLHGRVTDSAAPRGPQPSAHQPIIVGPNSSVGSGARAAQKAVSTVMGIAGGFLGGGGAPAGRAPQGPQLATCRIADNQMTVVQDAATGVSLRIAARRAGNDVTVYAEIAQSPDNGTFQASFLENPIGERAAPSAVGICRLWGEWNLSVSWTRTNYVNNQVVSRESGGFARAGQFIVPGLVSSPAAPDGMWRQLGFSNASHGARYVALTYPAPQSTLMIPVDLVVHVTRPEQNPVSTAPFILRMVENPNGFSFERAEMTHCAQQC